MGEYDVKVKLDAKMMSCAGGDWICLHQDEVQYIMRVFYFRGEGILLNLYDF
jgi:hypothetical protein